MTRIDGHVQPADIARKFADNFNDVYQSIDSQAESILNDRFTSAYSVYNLEHANDDLNPHFISWSEFLNCIVKIKTGKATGSFVKPQHVLHGSPLLSLHIHLLFNSLIQHGYVPHNFLGSIITLVVKDSSGDLTESKNYRPVALSSLFSQLFEHAILQKIGHLLHTDNLQFTFKEKHSASHALFVLRESVDFFTLHGSNTFVAFLDCSKAFDKISHKGLFMKLIERNVPLCFVNILIYWLSNLTSRCRWASCLSDAFPVTSGVKQGGVISPKLFNVYMDDLVALLRKAGVGCHVLSSFVGAIMFADDLALLAPSRGAIQQLISICETYCNEYCLSFNASKTKAMLFGSHFDKLTPSPLILNDLPIEYVLQWKYLGCLICAGKSLVFSNRNDLCAFRRSANSIVTSIRKPNEHVLMMLLHTFSVPILTYACEAKTYSCSEMLECHVAVNDAIRRIFSFNRWESIRHLRESFGFSDIYKIFSLRARRFIHSLRLIPNPVLHSLINCN